MLINNLISTKKNRIKFLIIMFINLFILFSISINTNAVGVQPLSLTLEMKPGETKEFELELTPEDSEKTTELTLYSFNQLETGALEYKEGNPDQENVLNWLDLPEKVTVPPGKEVTVTGEVSVPFEAEGSHTAVVMVEPVVENQEGKLYRSAMQLE